MFVAVLSYMPVQCACIALAGHAATAVGRHIAHWKQQRSRRQAARVQGAVAVESSSSDKARQPRARVSATLAPSGFDSLAYNSYRAKDSRPQQQLLASADLFYKDMAKALKLDVAATGRPALGGEYDDVEKSDIISNHKKKGSRDQGASDTVAAPGTPAAMISSISSGASDIASRDDVDDRAAIIIIIGDDSSTSNSHSGDNSGGDGSLALPARGDGAALPAGDDGRRFTGFTWCTSPRRSAAGDKAKHRRALAAGEAGVLDGLTASAAGAGMRVGEVDYVRAGAIAWTLFTQPRVFCPVC